MQLHINATYVCITGMIVEPNKQELTPHILPALAELNVGSVVAMPSLNY